jgi:hypothetical protein
MDRITADFTTLMRQAPATAEVYLRDAIKMIDNVLGEGYAAKHPELLGQFIITCAIDMGTATIGKAIIEHGDNIASSMLTSD